MLLHVGWPTSHQPSMLGTWDIDFPSRFNKIVPGPINQRSPTNERQTRSCPETSRRQPANPQTWAPPSPSPSFPHTHNPHSVTRRRPQKQHTRHTAHHTRSLRAVQIRLRYQSTPPSCRVSHYTSTHTSTTSELQPPPTHPRASNTADKLLHLARASLPHTVSQVQGWPVCTRMQVKGLRLFAQGYIGQECNTATESWHFCIANK